MQMQNEKIENILNLALEMPEEAEKNDGSECGIREGRSLLDGDCALFR